MAKVTSKALTTFAGKTIELVDAGACILTGTGQTVVPVQIAVLSYPSRFTITAVTIDVIPAGSVDARAASTLVHLGVAVRRLEPFGTLAVEAILLIHTGPSISAGAGSALVDLHIALGTCKARFANTVIAIDAIFANSIITRVTGTVVKVNLAVCAGGPMLALADILVDQVHALASVLAGVAVALVELVLTAVPGVTRLAVTGVAGNAVDTGPVMAGVRLAVVNITLTQRAFVTFSTAALKAIGPVVALGSILARCTRTLIDVNLTHGAGKAWLTGACEAINHVSTDAIIHTGITLTVVYVNFTVGSHVSWHTDAGELADAIQTSGIILARHGKTFINVYFTSRSCISTTTLTLE